MRSAFRRRLRSESLESRRLLAQIVVNTVDDDTTPNNGIVSLREALQEAAAATESSTITFEPSLTATAPATLSLTEGELDVASQNDLSIIGPGSSRLTIQQTTSERLLKVVSLGDVDVIGLGLRGGSTTDNNAGGGVLRIETMGNVTLDDLHIRDGRTSGDDSSAGGAWIAAASTQVQSSVFEDNITQGPRGGGGGLYVQGSLQVADSVFRNNRTEGTNSRGGALFVDGSFGSSVATADIRRTTIADNATTGILAHGGGVSGEQTTFRFSQVTMAGNRVQDALIIVLPNPPSVGGNLHLPDPSDGSRHRITASTIVDGVAARGGNVGILDNAVRVTFDNSIVARGSASVDNDDIDSPANPDVLTLRGSFLGSNDGTLLLEAHSPDADGNLIGSPFGRGVLDPQLGVLQNAGTDLPVVVPQTGSPVIDAARSDLSIDPISGEPITADARGNPFVRAFGISDMGAIEVQPPVDANLVWQSPQPVIVGTVLSDTQLNATVDFPGTLTYTPAAGTILTEGTTTLSVSFTPDQPGFVAAASAEVDLEAVGNRDYGDAPLSYGTLLADDGPRHAPSSLRLGDRVDYTLGASSFNDSDSDDDGVQFRSTLPALIDALTTIELNASEAGFLDAWIDFDGSGTFEAAEHVFGGSAIAVTAGLQNVAVDLTSASFAGDTFARFRVSSTGGLSPLGPADDGEVEDYRVTLQDPGDGPVTLHTTGNRIRIEVDAGDLLITQDGNTLFRAAVVDLQDVVVVGDEFSNVVEMDASLLSLPDTMSLTYDGGDRVDTAELIGQWTQLTVTTDSVLRLGNIEVINLRDAAATEVVIDADALLGMDPDGSGVVVSADAADGDFVTVTDPPNWSMGDPTTVASTVFNTLQTLGSFLQIDVGNGWHNLVRASDIDNNRRVDPVDALAIINELRRVSVHDDATGQLFPIADLEIFPGLFYDQNNDGTINPLDALRVINQIRRDRLEGELVDAAMTNMVLDDVDRFKSATDHETPSDLPSFVL